MSVFIDNILREVMYFIHQSILVLYRYVCTPSIQIIQGNGIIGWDSWDPILQYVSPQAVPLPIDVHVP